MRKVLLFISFLVITVVASAQDKADIRVDSEFGIDKEISLLMNELDLSQDQKLTIALLLLKYASEFDFTEYQDANQMGQYKIYRKSIKRLDKDLKGILDKVQYKQYKKSKKKIRKELTQKN